MTKKCSWVCVGEAEAVGGDGDGEGSGSRVDKAAEVRRSLLSSEKR